MFPCQCPATLRSLPLARPSCYGFDVPANESGSDALEALRREIDDLDSQIVDLLSRRAWVSRRVGELKQGDGRAVYVARGRGEAGGLASGPAGCGSRGGP